MKQLNFNKFKSPSVAKTLSILFASQYITAFLSEFFFYQQYQTGLWQSIRNTIISMQYGMGIIPFTTFDFSYKFILFVLMLSSFLSLIISFNINTKNRPQLVKYSILIYLGVFIIYYFLVINLLRTAYVQAPWNGKWYYLEVLTNWFGLGGDQLKIAINSYFTYSAIFIILNCLVKIIFFIFCFQYLFLASKNQAVKIKENVADLSIRFPFNKKIGIFVFLILFVFGTGAIRNNSPQVYEGPEDVNQAVDDLLTRLNSNRNLWEINELSTSSTGIYAKKRLGLYAQPDFVLQCNLPYSGTWLFLYSDEDSAYDAFNSDYFFRTDAYSAKFKYDPQSKFLVMLHTSVGGTPECLDSANSQLEDYATDSN
jgi:hypothetical protein